MSSASADNYRTTFDLTKAQTSQASLLKGLEGQQYGWGGIPCSLCESNFDICENSGQPISVCVTRFISCLRNCSGHIP